MSFLFWYVILTILDVIAVLSARLFSVKRLEWYRWISILSFGASAYVFTQLMAYESTAIVNVLWISVSTILIAIACVFLFGERINRWQTLGIVLILVGMGLL